MTDTTYNGWTNYETWAVKLWIDNEQDVSERWAEQARECYSAAQADKMFTRDENAAFALRDRLNDYYDDSADENGLIPELTGFYADLLNAALSEVNWQEIAKHMVDALEPVTD